jgi:hypothetical protein
MLALFLNPTVISILGTVILFFVGKWFKANQARAESNFELGVKLAYNIVSEISIRTPNTVDDKVALGLKYLRDFLDTNGQKMKASDEAKAKLLFQAMHGEEKLAEKAKV